MRKTPLRPSALARGSSALRSSPMPSGPIDRRRKPRSRAEFARIYGSKKRVAWIKAQLCVARGHGCGGPIENAHTVTGGMGRKADAATIVPLCHYHHTVLHNHGPATFHAFFGVNLTWQAARTEFRWLATQATA